MRRLLGDNDVLAYLVMMTARLQELYRVLKTTGSLYLHCDPTSSHYLKIMLDAIFGPTNYRNEIIWKRTNARSTTGTWPHIHDVLLVYGKSQDVLFKPQLVPGSAATMPHTLITGPNGTKYQTYELTGAGLTKRGESGKPWRGFDPAAMGRHWANTQAVMDEWDAAGLIHWPQRGGFPRRRGAEPFVVEDRMVPVGDVWTDIDRLNQTAKERLGYPTQKPLLLLERIIAASTNENDTVLDPFCGCGTTVDAAQKLGRNWIGIDITYLAIDLIDKRLLHTYGDEVVGTYKVQGIPHDLDGANALFNANPFDFERWAVSLVDGQANQKQVGDKGIDGVIRFPANHKGDTARALVSVKGGKQINPGMVRDLVGTVQQQKAEMGVFICMTEPTAGVLEVVRKSGTYLWPVNQGSYPKVQVLTVGQLLAGKRPQMPTPFLPYIQARRLVPEHPSLF